MFSALCCCGVGFCRLILNCPLLSQRTHASVTRCRIVITASASKKATSAAIPSASGAEATARRGSPLNCHLFSCCRFPPRQLDDSLPRDRTKKNVNVFSAVQSVVVVECNEPLTFSMLLAAGLRHFSLFQLQFKLRFLVKQNRLQPGHFFPHKSLNASTLHPRSFHPHRRHPPRDVLPDGLYGTVQ